MPAMSHLVSLGLNQKRVKTYQKRSLPLLQDLRHLEKILYHWHKQNIRISCKKYQ